MLPCGLQPPDELCIVQKRAPLIKVDSWLSWHFIIVFIGICLRPYRATCPASPLATAVALPRPRESHISPWHGCQEAAGLALEPADPADEPSSVEPSEYIWPWERQAASSVALGLWAQARAWALEFVSLDLQLA